MGIVARHMHLVDSFQKSEVVNIEPGFDTDNTVVAAY